MSIYEDNQILAYLHLFWNNSASSVIHNCWGGEDAWLAQHLLDKYNYQLHVYGTWAAPARFYTELDGKNQKKIREYAMNHYLGE